MPDSAQGMPDGAQGMPDSVKGMPDGALDAGRCKGCWTVYRGCQTAHLMPDDVRDVDSD